MCVCVCVRLRVVAFFDANNDLLFGAPFPYYLALHALEVTDVVEGLQLFLHVSGRGVEWDWVCLALALRVSVHQAAVPNPPTNQPTNQPASQPANEPTIQPAKQTKSIE